MTTALLYALALVAGLANPVQAGATSSLQRALGRPLLVGLASATGIVAVTLLGCALSGQLGLGGKAALVPPWAWGGGVIGALVVLAQPVVGPRIGAGAYIGLTVTSSAVASVVIDNYGWLDFPHHAASPMRVVGTALMVAGVGLVAAL